VQPGDVQIDGVWKSFRIYHDRNSTLKQRIVKRRRDEFEEFHALQGVSFEVQNGTTCGIIGANGAGKSTILKVLSRILVPDQGSVRVNGTVSALLELGAGFHPELTGRENVYLNGTILGMSKVDIDSRFDDIVAFSGIEHAIDKSVKTYSSGMYARLGFAVAINVDPDILIVDEVLAVGDEEFQRRCLEKMDELRSGGRTVILVSHSLSSVQQMCDYTVWLDKGVVRQQGTTIDVVNSYLRSISSTTRIDEQGRQREGTGEVMLEIDLLQHGVPVTGIQTDDPVSIRLSWEASAVVDDIEFEFRVRSGNGVGVFGARSAYAVPIDRLEPGRGQLVYEIPSLRLLPGAYQIAAFVKGRHSGHIYDGGWQLCSFDVSPRGEHDGEFGLVTVGGIWQAPAVSA
jgi:ABC-2 type transport system ATP-binding protein